MRIWDVPVGCLCRMHLLGEHRELHAVWNIITLGKRGYSTHPETKRWIGEARRSLPPPRGTGCRDSAARLAAREPTRREPHCRSIGPGLLYHPRRRTGAHPHRARLRVPSGGIAEGAEWIPGRTDTGFVFPPTFIAKRLRSMIQ